MLVITVPSVEYFDEASSTFVNADEVVLHLEHSLVSLSKWEETFEKAFLSGKEKTSEETLAYIEFMNTTPDVPSEVFHRLSNSNLQDINAYISAKRSAVWFDDERSSGGAPASRETVTSELIYYWMVSLQIPFECQHWHLNRLFSLIKVCNKKNAPPKKTPVGELAAKRRQMNEERKKKYGTSG